MTKKGRVRKWIREHETELAMWAGGVAALTGAYLGAKFYVKVLLKDTIMTDVHKLKDNSTGFTFFRKDVFGNVHRVFEITWIDPEDAKKVGRDLIEAADYTFEQTKNLSGWGLSNK